MFFFFNSLLKNENKSNQCSIILQNILGEENWNATSDYRGKDTPFKGESKFGFQPYTFTSFVQRAGMACLKFQQIIMEYNNTLYYIFSIEPFWDKRENTSTC